jgi:carboxymethylenebutenolidase
VVVSHEVHGPNDNIRDIARRFAAEGYAALAVDLFADRNRMVCMARLMGGMITGREPFGVTDLMATADFLVAQPEIDRDRVGAIGFCMGGGFAIAWARRDQRLRTIAPFYGTNPRPIQAVRRLCPVVGSYPGRDFSARSGRKLNAHLERLGVAHDIKIYPGARHSFFNDQGSAYDAAASTNGGSALWLSSPSTSARSNTRSRARPVWTLSRAAWRQKRAWSARRAWHGQRWVGTGFKLSGFSRPLMLTLRLYSDRSSHTRSSSPRRWS